VTVRRSLLSLVLTLTLTPLAGCTCGDSPPTPAPVAATPSPTPEAPTDPFVDQLKALSAAAASLPEAGPDREAALASLVNLARAVADAALEAKRADALAEAAEIARQAGADRFAGALLQRATGLLDPAEAGKDHLWALARVRTDEGRVLEAVSLLERAVHVEPTTPAEWVGLSRGYLLADRVGPARAAVTRGLRVHADNLPLKTQGAEVMLVSGRAAQALGILDTVLAADPDAFGAKIVRAECLLVLGKLQAAAQQAGELGTGDDAWSWIIRGAIFQVTGDGSARDEALSAAATIAGDCACTQAERAAIEWAKKLPYGGPTTPRARVHPNAKAPKLATPGSAAPASSPLPR
jgi:tetratricopeptide (TPR) repeat protein